MKSKFSYLGDILKCMQTDVLEMISTSIWITWQKYWWLKASYSSRRMCLNSLIFSSIMNDTRQNKSLISNLFNFNVKNYMASFTISNYFFLCRCFWKCEQVQLITTYTNTKSQAFIHFRINDTQLVVRLSLFNYIQILPISLYIYIYIWVMLQRKQLSREPLESFPYFKY